MRTTKAQKAPPTVVWVADDAPNRVSVPSHVNEQPDRGYHRVELRTIQERDAFARKLNARENAEIALNKAAEQEIFSERRKQTRDEMMSRLGQVNAQGRRVNVDKALALNRRVREYLERSRERRNGNRRFDANVHFQVDAFDQSNRQGYRSAETGWRERKD